MCSSSKIKAQVAWAKCHFRCTARCPRSFHHHGGWSCQPPGREATRIAHDQPWRSSATASDKKIGNLEAKMEMLRQTKFRQWSWQKPSYLCLCAASFQPPFFWEGSCVTTWYTPSTSNKWREVSTFLTLLDGAWDLLVTLHKSLCLESELYITSFNW